LHARALLLPYPASCIPSGLRAWAECAWDAAHPLCSVTGCRAMHLRSLVRRSLLGWNGGCHSWLRGQGEVSMCVMLTHSMVRTHIGCTSLLKSRAVEASGTPPAAGVSWWIHGVPCFPLRLLGKRAALSLSRSADSVSWVEGRARHGAAGGMSGGCEEWSPDVRTPVPSFLERSPALQTPVSPQRRCLALLPWWSPVRSREVGSGVCSETKR
jgi:hypothetical protein